MATNSNDSIQIRYSDPIYLYVCSGVDNSGNSNFGGYAIYVVKVPMFEEPNLSSSGLLYTRKLEHVKNIYPEIDVSYDSIINRIGDNPIRRMTYAPDYIYPVEYYVSEENWDHYFYLAAFDKDNNMSSGFVSHPKNPFRGPSVVARAIQFANTSASGVIYNSTQLYPTATYLSGTISYWITTPGAVPLTASTVVSKVSSARCPAPFACQITTSNQPRFLLGSAANATSVSTTYNAWTNTDSLMANTRYHVSFTWRNTTGASFSGVIFINGLPTYSLTQTITQLVSGLSTANTIIGAEGGVAAPAYSGLILDGLHFYPRNLSDAEIFTLYSGQLHGIRGTYLPNELYHKYSFDEGSGLITYANYPIVSPQISGVFYGDIRWVRPLYTELRAENVNTQVLEFFNTYVDISGNLNSGVIDPQNVSFQDRIFSTEQTKTIAETFKHPSQMLGQNVIPATWSFYNPSSPWGYSGFYSFSFAESSTYASILGYAPQIAVKGLATAGNSGLLAFDPTVVTNGAGANYNTQGTATGYFLYPSVYVRAVSSNLTGLLNIYFITSAGRVYPLYSGILTLPQTWTKYSIPSGINGNLLGTFYGKLMLYFESQHTPAPAPKTFIVDAPSVYLAPSGVYLDTPPWSLGTKFSGLVSPTYMSNNAIQRIFTSSGVKTEVESLNNSGVVANSKVPNSAMVDTRIVYMTAGGKIYDMLDAQQEIDGTSSIINASVSDNKFANTKILYLQDADTVKQVDGTTKQLKYTTLSGVQEYRTVFTSARISGLGQPLEFSTKTAVYIYSAPLWIRSSDVQLHLAAWLKSEDASSYSILQANLYDQRNVSYPTALKISGLASTYSGYMASMTWTGMVTGPGYVNISLDSSNIAKYAYAENIILELATH